MKIRASAKRTANDMRPQNERLASFLRGEIDDIEKTLERIKSPKAEAMRAEIKRIKEGLESADGGESAYFALSSRRRNIVAMKERAETLATKPGFLERIPPPVWLATIPLLLLIYLGCLAAVQRIQRPLIHSIATNTAAAQTASAAAIPNVLTPMPSVTETPAPASSTATR